MKSNTFPKANMHYSVLINSFNIMTIKKINNWNPEMTVIVKKSTVPIWNKDIIIDSFNTNNLSFERLVENSLNFSNRNYVFTGVPNNNDLWVLKVRLEDFRNSNNITIQNRYPYYLLMMDWYSTSNFSNIILSFYEKKKLNY